MTLTLTKTCSMGGTHTGLVGTIGVTLLNPDGTVHTARATATIYEIGGGCYGKQITFTDDWVGSIKWDTGGGSPVYAVEDYGTVLDEKINTILGLNQENFYIDNTTYTGVHMTGARIRIYSVAGSVGTASDVIATYTMTATYSGDEMDDYTVVKS